MSSYQTKPGAPVDTRYKAFNEGIKLWNVYSQSCEDSILAAIFERIGTANKWCFECGAADGLFFSNTKLLIDQGWSAVLVEPEGDDFAKLQSLYLENKNVYVDDTFIVASKRFATIDDVLARYSSPKDIDLVVIDIDSQDYYLLNSIIAHRPRVILVEYDPDADPMFIPELNGPGQAGHLALRYVAEARGYSVICRTATNLICVRKDLAKLLEEQPKQTPREQVYAAGRWQDVDAEVIEVHPDEFEVAKVGKLPTRQLVSEGLKSPRIAFCLSIPRLGFLRPFEGLLDVGHAAKADRLTGDGVFWHHSLSRGLKRAIEYRDPKAGWQYDYILTADYDTFASLDDLRELATLLARNPDYDAIVPLQSKRGVENEILVGFDKGNLNLDIIPIEAGHFGFTLFRREFFERLPKPWFWEQADQDGDWGPTEKGRIDADIGFWKNVRETGLKPGLATKIIIGHNEEVVSYPKIVNGQISKVYQTVNEWLGTKKKPAGIGVIIEERQAA